MFINEPKINNKDNCKKERTVGEIVCELIEAHLQPLKDRIAALEERIKDGNT